MKLSKLSITFALVVSAHVAILGFILLQPGCKSSAPEPLVPDKTVTANAETDKLQPPTSTEEKAPEFQPPTRPTWTETEEATGAVNASVKPGEAAPAATAATTTYTVERGDNLSKIAKKHGVSLSELMQANSLTSKSVLKVGQTLVIPAASAAVVAPVSGGAALPGTIEAAPGEGAKRATYTVQKGDSLSKIASRYHTSVSTLQRMNNLKGTVIRAGQKLAVPGGVTPAPEKASATVEKAVAVPAGGSSHKVASGETLAVIAKKYGVKLSALTAANPGVDARRLKVGQELVIPGSAKVAEPAAPAAPEAVTPEAPIAPEAPVVPEAAVVPTETATTAVPEASVVPTAPVTETPNASEL